MGQLLREWKANLAASTSLSAAYLQTTLLNWQREHNLQPDLSKMVLVDVPEGDGTVVLTASQAESLSGLLSAAELRGRVHVALIDRNETRLPGKPIGLLVNGTKVAIAGDRFERLRPLDPGPPMFLVSAFWFLSHARPAGADVPLARTVPQEALAIAAGAWAHRRVDRFGNDAHAQLLAVLVALSGLHTALATPSMRKPFSPEGFRRHLSLDALLGFVMLIPLYVSDLSRRQRIAMTASFISVLSLGFILTPRPKKMTHWILEAVWPLSAMVAVLGIGSAMEEDAVELQSELDDSSQAVISDSYTAGRESVIELVRRSRDSAWQHLADTDGMPVSLRDEILNRVREIDRRVEEMTCSSML